MKLSDIPRWRLINQQISGTKLKGAKELVQWMGAMQAQDYSMAKWAIGIRVPGSTVDSIEESLNKGEIVRTHLLRPTWHFVSSEDVGWMLELTAPRIKSAIKSRHTELELTEPIVQKSQAIMIKALKANGHLSREALMTELSKAKILTGNNRLSHLLLRAELDGLICSGITRGNHRTYMLLDSHVPGGNKYSRDEALALLGRRYFTSHGPATIQDFSWWSGLSITEARKAITMNKGEFLSEQIESNTYYFPPVLSEVRPAKKQAFLLPAFDEYVISYKNRSAVLTLEDYSKTISSNGIFKPLLVIDGQVAGLWKRTVSKKNILQIEITRYRPYNKSELGLITKASEKLGVFLGKGTSVTFL